jgi:hypothetical protein
MQRKLWWVGLFAIAMAYVESATVVYIRRIYGISDLMLEIPPFYPVIASIEEVREMSKLVMLMAVGWAVGKTFQSRLGFTLFTFGLWDIFYYLWLKLLIGWPNSFLATDILFLIPLPWWGPVIAPVLIACLMVISGITLILRAEGGHLIKPKTHEIVLFSGGILLLLYSFMQDALHALPAEAEELSALRPNPFPWLIYAIGFSIVIFGIVSMNGVGFKNIIERIRKFFKPYISTKEFWR